jgi:hypothetical protein
VGSAAAHLRIALVVLGGALATDAAATVAAAVAGGLAVAAVLVPHLASYQAMAAAVAEFLSPEAVTRTHQAAHQTIGALLARGQADGSFRTDLAAGWLVTAFIALVHACSDGVRAGQIQEHDALRILTTSIRDLFTGTRPGRQLHHAEHWTSARRDDAGQANPGFNAHRFSQRTPGSVRCWQVAGPDARGRG